nr:hypothetical protein [Tanacetum cinerariifolium]
DRIVDFPEGWMSFSKRLWKNTPQCYTKPLDSLKNWNNRFFWVDECVFPPAVEWRTNASKDRMPASGTYSVEAVRVLDTHRTPIQKQPEALLCLVARDSSGVPSAIERSPLDFADEAEASGRETAVPEMPPPEEVAPVVEKVLLLCNSVWLLMFLCLKVFLRILATPIHCRLLALLHPLLQMLPSKSSQGVAVAGDPVSDNVSSPVEVGSPGSVYRPEWGVTNGSLLDTPKACQDLVDHAAPPGYFSELRHMHNEDFLGQYNINLARQVAMGSQLRLRFEQEAKLLWKSVAQVARREQRIQARELEI